ncbi:transmembrane protein, putative (macronuclear) [Tetrahymena thermophila SB210]|uniref:Transmembrane protein, putative n=1 Tax=Tetrahymena thermophila (strain SB210) TaxID=312017 RepID=W7XJ61_TETTS|nr:transmembrane protein, putative [Tetrahymena thermophila SB210]EWS73884.1 transmembrane protein, putative [Tetrahymena thermophila SB210]|eukprot:XP_012653631.1 transmembrane protein, putative [Tetrahymena thermophila SB210]
MIMYMKFQLLLISLNLVFSSDQACPQGQGFDPYQNQCFKCSQNCETCQVGLNPSYNSYSEQYQTCQQCQSAFYLSEDQRSCLSDCEYYFDPQQNQCQQCQLEGCLLCTTQNTCKVCKENFQLKDGICVSDCLGQQQFLIQDSQCSFQCGLGQTQNNQFSTCQTINKCPIQYSESNYCHTYQVIYKQTILSIEKYIDNNSQEIMVSYDNIGNIKFWRYITPVISFLSEIQPTLSNPDNSLFCKLSQKQFYLCVYPQYIQAFDLKSPQIQEIRALQQSSNGILSLLDFVSYNGTDYICVNSEQNVLLFKVVNIFNNNSSLDWSKSSIQFQADSSYYICIVQFTQEILIYKSAEIWIDSSGKNQTGVLYKQQQAICYLYNNYNAIFRATEKIYILTGANNYAILILNEKSVQNCQEFIIQNMDTSNYFVSFMSSETKIMFILQNYQVSYNNLSYKLFNITQSIDGDCQVSEIVSFQQNTEMIQNQIFGDIVLYANSFQSNYIFKQDLNLLTTKQYFFNSYIYSIHIVDRDIVITTEENNIASITLNDNQSYKIDKQTICKTQYNPYQHFGMHAINIYDSQGNKYGLQGFQGSLQLRDMRNGEIILSTNYILLFNPLQNKLKNKIYLFLNGGILIIDFTKDPQNESEFLTQIVTPRASSNGIPFFDDDENFYIYNFDYINWKSVVAYTSNGQIIKEIPARLDLTYSQAYRFFYQAKKIVCLVDQTDAILSYFDFINFTTYDFKLFNGQQAENLLYANQIIDENIICITANNMFIIDFLDNNLIPLQVQYSAYGNVIYQIVYGDFILASYNLKKIQIIHYPSSSESVIQCSQSVSQIITFYDQIHFGFIQGLNLNVYSLSQNLIKQVFQIQLPSISCEQQMITYFSSNELSQEVIYLDQDNSGICSIYGNIGINDYQVQMKVPGQMYLDYISLSKLNYINLVSCIDISANKIYLVLRDSQNNMFLGSTLYKQQLNINIIAQINQPTLINIQGIQSYGNYQTIYFDNGFIIYKNESILQMIDNIPSYINQFIIDFQEDILVISNSLCQWFVFKFSTGQFMYDMPQDSNYNPLLKCTSSFDRVNKNILFKQTTQITSFSYSQNTTNWFLTTQILGNTNMDIDIDQIFYYEHPINAVVSPNQKLLIQIMYLDDKYTTSDTQVRSIDISQYSQTFSQYNQQTKFTIIEDFQKDILIIVFADNIFFIKISQTQIIHYLNFQENLSQSKADGQITYISLDKQSNILACTTQENILIYDYSSIVFYDYQNFYLGPQNADLINYITQGRNQNDNLIAFAREFNYNKISFYQVSLQNQTITPFLSLDVTEYLDLQFTLKGGPLGQTSNINNSTKYNYRIIQIQKQVTNDLYYQYYALLEELSFFPILILQNTIASTLYLQILDYESKMINLISSQFQQVMNDCNIRNQTVYCFDQQGINLIEISIQDPKSFKITQISQLDQQLIFYCNNIVFSWNPSQNKLSKFQMVNNIQQLKIGNQYILLELEYTFDITLVAINQDGALVKSLYNLIQPAQKLRDLSSSNQIPHFYNKKYEESKISEQISQFLVLQTFGQANIYSLIDFSLYLTIRSLNITNIQQIQILSKSIMLLASKAEIQVYYFSKNNYNLLQSFQASLPIIGYATLNSLQQLNIFQLSMVISSNNDIRLLQYTLTTDQNVDSQIYTSNQQCVLTFSDYVQDLSLLQYTVKIQAIQDQFVSKNYANIQVIEIYFIPQTSLYLRQDIFQTLTSSNFTLRLYSDSQNALVYLINQNYNNINAIFNPSIVYLEILNMMLTIPQQPQNKQLITPIAIDINNSKSLLSISMTNTIVDLDSQVCIIFQNMNELIFSNSEFITSQHLITSSSYNTCMILIKNVNFVYLDRLTFKNFTIQNKSSSLKYVIAFDSIQNLSISNIAILKSNLQINSIFNFQNIGNLTLNNILVNITKSSGSIISSSNINSFFIQSLQIYDSQFEGKSYSLIQTMGSLINNLQNITVKNISGPSLIQIQEQFYNKVIVIVSQVTINDLSVINSQFNDQQNPSIYVSSLNTDVENMSIQNGIFNSDIYSSIIFLNSFQHKNLDSQLDSQSCLIQQSQFNNNNLQTGQVIYVFQHSEVTFNYLIVNMNQLLESFYGTVSFDTTQNIIINNSLFSNNTVQKGCGGGIYITNSQVQLNNCTICYNYAVIGGGIRYQEMNSSLIYKDKQYKYRRLDIQQSQIFNNKALLFGQQITSYPKSFKFHKNYTQMLSQVVSGSTLSQPLIFYLVDEFEEVVNYPLNIETNKIHQLIIQEFQGYDILIVNQDESKMHIQGGIQIYNNYITFQPQITSNPSSKQFLQIQLSSKVPIYDFQQNYFKVSSIESIIYLKFLPCQAGQIPKQEFNLISCYECPQGTYSFISSFSNSDTYQCSHCPEQASYCEKDIIVLQDGYWRLNPQSSKVFACSNPSNCIQTQNQQNYNLSSIMPQEQFEKSICSVGHIGALCESCDINNQLWGNQYSKSSNLSCIKCKDNYIDIITYFLLYLAILGYLSFSFRKIQRFTTQKCLFLYIKRLNFICIGKSSESDQNTVATKILINYVQIITIIFQFTNFSPYLRQIISIFGDSSSDSIFKIYNIKCSFIFLWLFFSPSLINYFVQQLSCVQIGDYSYVITDKQYICFGHDHKQNIFYILIPSLVLLYLLLPLFFFKKLKQKRTCLTKIENIKVYGILFYEYRKEKYYWEIIKTTQKSLIYLCTFVDNIGQKALVSLSILFLYGIASFFSRPYNSIQLNNLDLMATILQFNSIVLAIIINLMENTVWESISTTIIFFFNFMFIVKIMMKVILREIPLDIKQRNFFHWLLIKIKNIFPKFLTAQIIIQSSNKFQVMRRWSKIQKEVFKYMKLKKRNSNKQQNNDQADEIIEEDDENTNLIIEMNQQTSLFGLSNSVLKSQNTSYISLQSKIDGKFSTEKDNLKSEKFQLVKTDDEFINYFDENSVANSPTSFLAKKQSKNMNFFEPQQTQYK